MNQVSSGGISSATSSRSSSASVLPSAFSMAAANRSSTARRSGYLPLDVAVAAMETIDGPLTTNPHRAGKPLEEPFDGYHSARRGTYRIIHRINEDKHTVEIHSIRHRRDAYRT